MSSTNAVCIPLTEKFTTRLCLFIEDFLSNLASWLQGFVSMVTLMHFCYFGVFSIVNKKFSNGFTMKPIFFEGPSCLNFLSEKKAMIVNEIFVASQDYWKNNHVNTWRLISSPLSSISCSFFVRFIFSVSGGVRHSSSFSDAVGRCGWFQLITWDI